MKKLFSIFTVALVGLFATVMVACNNGNGNGNNPVAVTGVTLNISATTLDVGETKTLLATVLPTNATNKNVRWSSSDNAVATVTAGVVTAIGAGPATITVTTEEGSHIAECEVTVSEIIVPEPDVYVAGFYVGGYYTHAIMLKNEEMIYLEVAGEFMSEAKSVAVSDDGDVYVAGYVTDSNIKSRPVLWINGEPNYLSENTGYANSVFISGDDVYVAGQASLDASTTTYAVVWKNDEPFEQVGATASSIAYSVYVSDNGDVYAAGREREGLVDKATIWKNGVAQTLPDGTEALSVYVYGTDVYAAGIGSNKAIYWKNGAATALSTNASKANSMFVSEGDVYVVGYETDTNYVNHATLWKNGEPQTLDSDAVTSNALGTYVYGSDVYVAITKALGGDRTAVLWKNDESKTLGEGVPAGAAAVFVK